MSYKTKKNNNNKIFNLLKPKNKVVLKRSYFFNLPNINKDLKKIKMKLFFKFVQKGDNKYIGILDSYLISFK